MWKYIVILALAFVTTIVVGAQEPSSVPADQSPAEVTETATSADVDTTPAEDQTAPEETIEKVKEQATELATDAKDKVAEIAEFLTQAVQS